MRFDPRYGRLTPPVIIATLAVSFGFAAEVVGQEKGRVAVEEGRVTTLGRGLKSFSPRSGPPGTLVTLHAEDMPIRAPLRIGVGALRLGFEEVGWILSDEEGKFTFELEIPTWARYDLTHVFIVFDPYFNPIALSEVFHVTSPEGTVRREGRIAGDEDGCPTLEGADQVSYALAGDVSGHDVGAEVEVEGTIAERAACGDRTIIEIVRIGPAEDGDDRPRGSGH